MIIEAWVGLVLAVTALNIADILYACINRMPVCMSRPVLLWLEVAIHLLVFAGGAWVLWELHSP